MYQLVLSQQIPSNYYQLCLQLKIHNDSITSISHVYILIVKVWGSVTFNHVVD